jgi:hypothetical protein
MHHHVWSLRERPPSCSNFISKICVVKHLASSVMAGQSRMSDHRKVCVGHEVNITFYRNYVYIAWAYSK